MADYKIEISSDTIPNTQVSSYWKTGFRYKREPDEIFYTLEIADEMLFRGSEYELLIDLESSVCEVVTVVISRKCPGDVDYSTFWQGYFTFLDCKVNKDKCYLTVTPQPDTKINCLRKVWDVDQNINSVGLAVVVNPFAGNYESRCCKTYTFNPTPPSYYDVDYCIPEMPHWCKEFGEVVSNEPDAGYDILTCWHRLKVTSVCVGGTPEPPDDSGDWTLITNNCPSSSVWWKCPNSEEEENIGKLRYGREFSDVITYMIEDNISCGLTIVSDFFGINGDDTHPENDAYDFAAAYLQALTVHQKSDIKRPYASNQAESSVWKMTIKDLLDDLRTLFNVYWEIDEATGNFRLEHASFWEAGAGSDYSGVLMKKELEYDTKELVNKEKFFFSDEIVSDYFLGDDIVYPCGENTKENRCKAFTTDVVYIRHDENNQENIADDNFVLISTGTVDGNRIMIRLNRALSFTELHDKLHRHYRPYPEGDLNGSPETFESSRPLRKQAPFSVPSCCEDFDPSDYVTTDLGTAYVDEAGYNLAKDILTLTLKYMT